MNVYGNLNEINWKLCNEYATKNIVKEICDNYKNGKTLKDIASEYKMSKDTIRKYIKRGEVICW